MLGIDKKAKQRLKKIDWFLDGASLPSREIFEIVIPRVDEDIKWTQSISDNITIINRGEGYFNEFVSFLEHICLNYNHLADKTLFLRGEPFKYKMFKLQNYISINHDFISKYDSWWKVDSSSFGKAVNGIYKEIFKHDVPSMLIFNYGSQFCIKKESILKNSIDFYQVVMNVARRALTSVDGFAIDQGRIFQILEAICPHLFDSNPIQNMWWQEYCPLFYYGK